MEWIYTCLFKPVEMFMSIRINMFGFVFTFWDLFILTCIIGLLGVLMSLFLKD